MLDQEQSMKQNKKAKTKEANNRTNVELIIKISNEAAKCNMSYGQYVAKYGHTLPTLQHIK